MPELDKAGEVAKAASEAFWAVVADRYPEIKRGDVDPMQAHEWDAFVGRHIRGWVAMNQEDDYDESKYITAFEILHVLRTTVTLPCFVDQTGGGTATIYIGYKGPDGRYTLALGPGSYDWAYPDLSSFYMEDLTMGPDTEAQEVTDCVTIHSLEDVRIGVKSLLLKLDERFVEVFK